MLAAVRDRFLRGYVDRFQELAETTEPVDWWAALDAECDAAIDTIARPGGLHDAIFHFTAAGEGAERWRQAVRDLTHHWLAPSPAR